MPRALQDRDWDRVGGPIRPTHVTIPDMRSRLSEPIPIVLNVACWAAHRPPLTTWLAEEHPPPILIMHPTMRVGPRGTGPTARPGGCGTSSRPISPAKPRRRIHGADPGRAVATAP